MHHVSYMTRKMAIDSTDNSANLDGQIAYHEEMESLAYKAGDYTKAEHHRKMKEICKAIKEKNQARNQPQQETDTESGPTTRLADLPP